MHAIEVKIPGSRHRRLPAEWEAQSTVLIAWPRAEGDWAPYLAEVRACYQQLAAAIAARARLLVLAEDPAAVRAALGTIAAEVIESPAEDTWTRDYGPITVLEDAQPRILDFGFNGWGLKFAAAGDNLATRSLHAEGHLGKAPLHTVGLILEGGSIESDGQGTILTTTACLMSPHRNPHLGKAEVEAALAQHLGADHILWLDHGHLQGDDTDAHVDTIARLCPNNTIAYVRCDDPADEHFGDFQRLEAQLATLRTRDGQPYRLVPLPWAAPCFAPDDGRRLPATYANFLLLNGAVLMPTYGDQAKDAAAVAAAQVACPGYAVVTVDCSALICQHGSLHCSTMQIPREVFP